MDTDGDAHEKMLIDDNISLVLMVCGGGGKLTRYLWALDDEAFDFQQVGSLQSFETEIVESIVARMHDSCVKACGISHDDAVCLLADEIVTNFHTFDDSAVDK